jgi:hypothetical protein
MTDKKEGYVYILTNPSFRDDWVKIGKSSRPVDIRSKELDNTAIPLPFEVYATLRTVKYSEAEKMVHRQIDRLTDLRIRKGREFFNVRPEQALEILTDIALVLDDAEIQLSNEHQAPYIPTIPHIPTIPKKPTIPQKPSRPPFKFSMVGIDIGETITFNPTGIEVKIASDNQIEHDGTRYSLSGFAAQFMPNPNKWGYTGPLYFSYKGKVLNDMRTEKEHKEKHINE